jgi:hypothetical protein
VAYRLRAASLSRWRRPDGRSVNVTVNMEHWWNDNTVWCTIVITFKHEQSKRNTPANIICWCHILSSHGSIKTLVLGCKQPCPLAHWFFRKVGTRLANNKAWTKNSRSTGNTPASYLEGCEFKSRPGNWIDLLRRFVVFLSPSRKFPGQYHKLGHHRSLAHPLQSMIY